MYGSGGAVGRLLSLNAQNTNEGVHRARAAIPGEQNHVAVRASVLPVNSKNQRNCIANDAARLFTEATGLNARKRGRRVRVRVHGEHLVGNVILDKLDGFSRRGVVNVRLSVRFEGAIDQSVKAHEVFGNGLG